MQQEHVLLMSPRPAGRRRRCGTPPTRWRWPSATTPAAGCTGRWSIRAWPSRPTAAYHEYEGERLRATRRSAASRSGPAENLEIVRKVLAEVQRDGITAEELRQAKSKIASRVVRGSERPMGRMQAIASAWTYTGEYRDVDDELARFDAVTLDDDPRRTSTATRSTRRRSSRTGR